MLSQSNINKLCMTGLYRHKPDFNKFIGMTHRNMYHCKNWTFTVLRGENSYYMVDTYWHTGGDIMYDLTDENFDDFEFIFDFNKVKETNTPEEYEEDDVYLRIPTNSGGVKFAKDYVKIDTKPSKEKLIKKCKEEIENCERQLNNLKRDLEQFENGTHWKLK